jgi:hypothetical protein
MMSNPRLVMARALFWLIKPALDEHETREAEKFLAMRESLLNFECGLGAPDKKVDSGAH